MVEVVVGGGSGDGGSGSESGGCTNSFLYINFYLVLCHMKKNENFFLLFM